MMNDPRPAGRVGASLRLLLLLSLILLLACGKGGEKGSSSPASESAPTATGSSPEAAAPAANPEQEALDSLVSTIEAQRFDDAAAQAQRFLEKYPSSAKRAQVLYIRGRALVFAGKHDDGIAILRDMVAKYPKDENTPFAVFYAAQGEYMKAYTPLAEYKIEFDQALPQFQKAHDAFREVARSYAADREVSIRAQLMVAQTLFDMRRREEALAGFQEYLKKEPQGIYAGQALFQTGALLAELERNEEARAAFARVIKDFPGTEEASTSVDRMAELDLIGKPMPEIQVARWIVGGLSPQSWNGKVVVVTFWNTWCSHCQHDMPKIDALYRKLSAPDLVMMGITDNTKGQNDYLVRTFVDAKHLTFPIGIDEHGITNSRYAVSQIPATAIIDREGIVRWRNSGTLLDEALIERFLKPRAGVAAPPAHGGRRGDGHAPEGGNAS